eukprot:TRINITY_DN9059_c0_g1_i2.p1 TRINITY_DN9059_c0_g1~~TRINITY_DN9059_c0_g1_i2.p1  ORF type:complete len:147 (-),score=19.68 TRINITY_DN9059_c0_g1_i2:6-446(-)
MFLRGGFFFFFFFFFFFGIAAFAAIRLFYGPQWIEAVPLAQILCLVGAVELIHYLSKEALIAAEDVKRSNLLQMGIQGSRILGCLLYTSDAADDMQCVDLGGRRINKKKKKDLYSREVPQKNEHSVDRERTKRSSNAGTKKQHLHV